MRSFSLFTALPFIHSIVSCLAQNTGTSQPPGLDGVVDPKKAGDLLNYWKDFACYIMSDQSEPNIKEQCKEACFPGGITSDVPADSLIESSQTCWLNGPELDHRTGKELTDDQKKEKPRTFKTIRTGYCTCNDPIINIAGDFFMKSVIEAGKILTKVMCPTLLALDIVVEIGSAAIPGVGKAITVGMRTGIKTAKMFKYAYEAEEAAMEWASMFVDQGFGLASEAGCKTPFKFSKTDLAKRFVDFSDAPDELVPGINYDTMPCPKGKKASKKCRERTGDRGDDGSASKTKDPVKSTAARSASASAVSSTVSSSPSPLPKTDCAAIGRRDMEVIQEDNQESKNETSDREDSNLQHRSVRLDIRAGSYSKKKGTACGNVNLWSKPYPPAGADFMKGGLAFGYSIQDDCSNYDWEAQAGPHNIIGDTEHVLEWSMVREFFTRVNEHADFKNGFDSPDPENKDHLDFCKYWKESWDWPSKQKMPNPDPAAPAPVPGVNPLMQTPFDWFNEVYPFIDGTSAKARRAHEDEFMVLQKKINEGAKNRMFAEGVIYNDNDMEKIIIRNHDEEWGKNSNKKGLKFGELVDQPRRAIQRLRSVVGVYIYLKDKRVNAIFVDQVNRIGRQLEFLERALAQHTRKVKRKATDSLPERDVSYDPWKYLNLEKKWYEHMDFVYERANKKGVDFMDKNLKRLREEYKDSKMLKQSDIDKEKDNDKKKALRQEQELRQDMKTYITKLEDEWSKRKNWPKPKWNT